jgi:hypothetical protein
MNALLTGFVLGAAGSVHCVAMCGPLVLAVNPRGWRALSYHAGRWAVYGAIGVMAGVFGASFTVVGLGRWLAFLMAGIIAWQAATRSGFGAGFRPPAWFVRNSQSSSRSVLRWAQAHPVTGGAALGALNGLLPCGLVYAAAAAAIGLGGLVEAPLFMAGFAIGTTPLLVGGSLALNAVTVRVPALRRATPLLLVLLAVLLVARGLRYQGKLHVH